ncbi:MAG: hypothetical protein MZV63_09165 [Marinilabiliales bacterium]|nr:hypothetical protein [Marinilabiliales bacterium]
MKNYASPLEEMRADLFALYFMMDPKMTETGTDATLMSRQKPCTTVISATGLSTQIVRIKPGKDIEQAHMRCRSAIAHWVL